MPIWTRTAPAVDTNDPRYEGRRATRSWPKALGNRLYESLSALLGIRRLALEHIRLENATCGSIRLMLLKIGARVRVSHRRHPNLHGQRASLPERMRPGPRPLVALKPGRARKQPAGATAGRSGLPARSEIPLEVLALPPPGSKKPSDSGPRLLTAAKSRARSQKIALRDWVGEKSRLNVTAQCVLRRDHISEGARHYQCLRKG